MVDGQDAHAPHRSGLPRSGSDQSGVGSQRVGGDFGDLREYETFERVGQPGVMAGDRTDVPQLVDTTISSPAPSVVPAGKQKSIPVVRHHPAMLWAVVPRFATSMNSIGAASIGWYIDSLITMSFRAAEATSGEIIGTETTATIAPASTLNA